MSSSNQLSSVDSHDSPILRRVSADRRRRQAGVADGQRLVGDTDWDVHYALYAHEFGQVRESAGQEPGFHFFGSEDISKPH